VSDKNSFRKLKSERKPSWSESERRETRKAAKGSTAKIPKVRTRVTERARKARQETTMPMK
jgi:hypothetical protein